MFHVKQRKRHNLEGLLWKWLAALHLVEIIRQLPAKSSPLANERGEGLFPKEGP